MNYFVSIENKVYHHWQIEFLIESFKLKNLEDSLVIAMAKNDGPKSTDFTCNLKTFKRIFIHDNFGKQKNRPHSLFLALKEKIIQQPFVLIDPDMVLVEPIKPPDENISFQLDANFKFAKEVENQISKILQSRNCKEPAEKFWIPLGKIMYFNDVSLDFFKRVLEWLEKFDEKLAWILTLIEYNGILKYNGIYNYEMSLYDHNIVNNFIHYNHGLPPFFHKLMHLYENNGFTMGDLFSQILENDITSSTNFFQIIVRSYLSHWQRKKLDLSELEIKQVKVGNETYRN